MLLSGNEAISNQDVELVDAAKYKGQCWSIESVWKKVDYHYQRGLFQLSYLQMPYYKKKLSSAQEDQMSPQLRTRKELVVVIQQILDKTICLWLSDDAFFQTDSKNDEERGGHQVGLALFLFTRVDCKLHGASLQPTT